MKWYDVNSLYSFAMLNKIPIKPLEFINDLSKVNLEDFFGFALARVETPINNPKFVPIAPFRDTIGKIIYPTGLWMGVYFSEELKYFEKSGYKITLISGLPFTYEYPFTKFVHHFYAIKENAKDKSTRFIAKMALNQLYGYMGRDRTVLDTRLVNETQLKELMITNIVQSVFEVPNCLNGEELYIVLINSNLNNQMFKKFNKFISPHKLDNFTKKVKSNVAISAAVTSYGRIHMAWFKQNFNIFNSELFINK